MGRGGYLGIRGYRGLAVVDVATIGESDSLLEHGPHMVGYGEVGFELQLHTNSFFGGVWYGIHTTYYFSTTTDRLNEKVIGHFYNQVVSQFARLFFSI